MGELVDLAVHQYGPIAFGLVALLVLWGKIVKPQLDEAKDDQRILREEAKVDREAQQATAETLKETALVLKGVVRELKEVKDALMAMKDDGIP